MRRRLADRLLVQAQVRSVEQRTPRLRQVTLSGPGLSGLAWVPGQQVRLQVADSPAAVDWLVGALRTYSVWDYDGQDMRLIMMDHGDGPGAAWSRTVAPGQDVMLIKPQGTFVTAPAAYHLFAGEETAQVAFGPMLRALPDDAPVFARLETGGPDDQLDLGREKGDIDWVFRAGRPAASSEGLVDAVRALTLPEEPGRAYLAGEARTVQMVRRHLVQERGWPRRNVLTKPFWTPGRTGLD
ncbi:siderophore-interacting protein [Kineosporia sp. J2-2]|uniref:Siderophore-interacting protein n=1 Tax=Kineosporia corallincola TaxID=2835133 RepID=A0ABS5TFT8_9ACTN|nr:siderophore-interacting protein [Kineosporia corallincola]MBT0769915.1 siderophore-interacting protein [Kineosporia corallincola]